MILQYRNNVIHYTVSGKGAAVILLHGFLETSDMWKDFIPELSNKNQVVSIDLLGHGKTGCIGYVHSMLDMADTVSAVLKHLKINMGYFIGHSMGGYVALALAQKRPQLFKGLCLMNSTFESDNEEKQLIRTRANKMAQTNYKNLVKLSFANLFTSESKVKYKKAYKQALFLALQTPIQGYIAAQEGMKIRPNRFEVLKSLKCKKLIIIGKKDTLVDGPKLINKIKNTTIEYSELSEGHMSHIENKSDLSYIIIRFVEK